VRQTATRPENAEIQKRIGLLHIEERKKDALLSAAEHLLADRKVLGVAIIGSISRGETNPNDIDLVVLVRGSRYATRRRIYHRERVHMLIRGIERFIQSNLRRAPERWRYAYPPLSDAVILWDSEGTLAAARGRQRRLRSIGPSRVLPNEAMRLRAELTESLEALEACRADELCRIILATQFIARCAEVHLRLRGFWAPTRENLPRELKTLAPEFAGLCQKALSQAGRADACLRMARRAAEKALASVGGLVGEYEVCWD
jgi:predicted nucleotidyltransferase